MKITKEIEIKEMNTVTYSFEDGTKVSQPINRDILLDVRGKMKSPVEIMNIFRSTMFDKGAISFTIDSEIDETIVKTKEQHYTRRERYNAKRDYKEFKANTEVFIKERNKFRNVLIDKLSGKIRFNLTNISTLK